MKNGCGAIGVMGIVIASLLISSAGLLWLGATTSDNTLTGTKILNGNYELSDLITPIGQNNIIDEKHSAVFGDKLLFLQESENATYAHSVKLYNMTTQEVTLIAGAWDYGIIKTEVLMGSDRWGFFASTGYPPPTTFTFWRIDFEDNSIMNITDVGQYQDADADGGVLAWIDSTDNNDAEIYSYDAYLNETSEVSDTGIGKYSVCVRNKEVLWTEYDAYESTMHMVRTNLVTGYTETLLNWTDDDGTFFAATFDDENIVFDGRYGTELGVILFNTTTDEFTIISTIDDFGYNRLVSYPKIRGNIAIWTEVDIPYYAPYYIIVHDILRNQSYEVRVNEDYLDGGGLDFDGTAFTWTEPESDTFNFDNDVFAYSIVEYREGAVIPEVEEQTNLNALYLGSIFGAMAIGLAATSQIQPYGREEDWEYKEP
jgi:hypothetical protein